MALVTTSEEVFACYRRSCAPPPVGTGGSNKGGARGGDKARRAGIAAAKERSLLHNKAKRFGPDQEAVAKAEHEAVRRAGKVAVAKHNIRTTGKAKTKNTPNEFETANTAYDKYRELQAKNRAKKSPKAEASELRRGGTETLKGMGSWNGGKLGRYKNGQYYVKPPNSSPIPLAARSKQAAYDEITKRK